MSEYFKELSKIEFVLTYACTGRCKHCSEGDHSSFGEKIDSEIASDAVRRVVSEYPIKTVMVFGGEPLIYPDAVYRIMRTAKECGVPRRQVITNGYFSKDAKRIGDVARELSECGVNDLLLSVDAFHQETIPIEVVKLFAREAKTCGIPIRLQPAWLVSPTDDNPYNRRTVEVLDAFRELELPVGDGNVIFPEGNTKKYLAEYFVGTTPENPYVDDPKNVKCLSFEPNGNVLCGNVYKTDILEIMQKYAP